MVQGRAIPVENYTPHVGDLDKIFPRGVWISKGLANLQLHLKSITPSVKDLHGV
jgi:hypothetical protein